MHWSGGERRTEQRVSWRNGLSFRMSAGCDRTVVMLFPLGFNTDQ